MMRTHKKKSKLKSKGLKEDQSTTTIRSMHVKDFELSYTLECGQFFRFFEEDRGYYIQVRDKIIYIAQPSKTKLLYKGCRQEDIIHLFRLDENYQMIKDMLLKDDYTRLALRRYSGLRLMRQDPWECTISYICSAAANIPKIQLNLNLLSRCFGKRKLFDQKEFYTFPRPGTMLCDESIRRCKTGFRTRYIHAANSYLTDRILKDISKMSYPDAKEELMQLPGIGEKVADCILLFSLGFDEAFPIDVWIRRIMQKLYFDGKNVQDKRILELAGSKWGRYAGYAQEYLYMYARMNA